MNILVIGYLVAVAVSGTAAGVWIYQRKHGAKDGSKPTYSTLFLCSLPVILMVLFHWTVLRTPSV